MTPQVQTKLEPVPEAPGYYGVPAIHRPHWKWLIIGYFFMGGISGGAAVVASFTRLLAGPRAAGLARIATYVSIAALAPCPVLLILDLGRPARFLNMLRVVRPSSPMSIGTWGLTFFGLCNALQTLIQLRQDLDGEHEKVIGPTGSRGAKVLAAASGATGFFVAGYTGVLLAATAVPLWSKRPALLGPLFLSSGLTSGVAAVQVATTLFSSSMDEETEHALQRMDVLCALSEGALLVAWLGALGETSRPLREGLMGYVVRDGAGGVGVAAPLLMRAAATRLPRRLRRVAMIAASALTLLGGFMLRYAIVEGGRRSADDPNATFDLTG